MTVRDIIHSQAYLQSLSTAASGGVGSESCCCKLPASTPVSQAIRLLSGGLCREITVVDDDDDSVLGSLDATGMLSAINQTIEGSMGCSWLDLEMEANQYCASAICRAVEDADSEVLTMARLHSPASEGRNTVKVSVCVNCENPQSVARSLQRYGYEVVAQTDAHGLAASDAGLAAERLAALNLYLNI